MTTATCKEIWKVKYLFWTAIYLAENYIIMEERKGKQLLETTSHFCYYLCT